MIIFLLGSYVFFTVLFTFYTYQYRPFLLQIKRIITLSIIPLRPIGGLLLMLENYYTVKQEGSDQMIVQKSRFIGYIRRVETEQDALDFIHEIKKKHYDATHNCSA